MSFFLRHFAGFLIQIGGGMVLCMFSFTKEAFRYPRKWVIAGYTALTILFSAGFPLVMCIPLFQGAQYQSLAATAYMLFVILLFTVLYFWIIRAEIIKKLVVLVLVLFYTATQYLLVNLVMPLFPDSVLPDVYPPLGLALYAGTAAILFPLAVVFMLRVVREYLAEVELKNIRREFGAVLLLTILYLFMMVLYFSLLDGLMEVFWWWLIPPFLLTMAVLGVFYWTLFRESVRRKRDSEERKALEIQKLQYESITREMENARRMPRHHPRCGTSFLFVVIFVSILVSSVVFGIWPITNVWLRTLAHLILLPLVVGITYEFNRWVGRHVQDSRLAKILTAPGMWMQNFTTNEPDDSMIECAIRSLELVLPSEKGKDEW